MQVSPSKSIRVRARDFVFGIPETFEEAAVRRAAPPRLVRVFFWIVRLAFLGLMLVALLWSSGWLPLADSTIDKQWFWAAFGLNLLQQAIWTATSRRYYRAAKREAETSP